MSSESVTSHLLKGDESDGQFSDAEKHETVSPWKFKKAQTRLRRYRTGTLLYGSIALNLLQGAIILLLLVTSHVLRSSPRDTDTDKKTVSKFAMLEDDSTDVVWDQSSVYTSANYTEADLAWDAINHDSGIVAVPKEWATAKGLPLGSTFPWDDSKSIYFVNAYHGLHCLKNIYRSIMEYREDRAQSLEYHHITHCLDQLRADVQCSADDSLRVTTPDMRPVTGEGQVRSCRSWDALRAWTLENQGCYRYGDPAVEDVKQSQIPRMRYCREGTPELDRVRDYFGKGKDWRPASEKVWSWFDLDSTTAT